MSSRIEQIIQEIEEYVDRCVCSGRRIKICAGKKIVLGRRNGV